jgi:hypothetical protein
MYSAAVSRATPLSCKKILDGTHTAILIIIFDDKIYPSCGWDLAKLWMRSSLVVNEILLSCGWDLAKLWMRSSQVVDKIPSRVVITLSNAKGATVLQSQHPPTQWNLRGRQMKHCWIQYMHKNNPPVKLSFRPLPHLFWRPLFTFNPLGAGHTTMSEGKRLLVSVIQKTRNFLPKFYDLSHWDVPQIEFSAAFIQNSDQFIEDHSKLIYYTGCHQEH